MKHCAVLLCMVLFLSGLEGMPVPSETIEKGNNISVESGGAENAALGVLGFTVYYVCPIAGLYMVLDNDENNDNWGRGLLAVYIVPFIIIMSKYEQ